MARPGPPWPDRRTPPQPQHADRVAPQHRRSLRPRQRLLPALARRDDDLLERGLRAPRPASRRRAAREVPRAWPSWPASSRGQHVLEIGTGWGGFALYAAGELGCRVTDGDHLAGAARPGPRARSPRPAWPTAWTSSCTITATSAGTLRRHRVDRDAGGRRRRVLPGLLRRLRRGAAARWPYEHPGHRLPA